MAMIVIFKGVGELSVLQSVVHEKIFHTQRYAIYSIYQNFVRFCEFDKNTGNIDNARLGLSPDLCINK